MIAKDLDNIQPTDRWTKAGFEAEQKMAHYLKRAFEDDPEVIVLNGIRLRLGDDTAQMDHLIIHEYGIIIVESKSATCEIQINEHGEWIRTFRGRSEGMASPIKQAERQADFLEKYLDRYGPSLPENIFSQYQYSDMPIDVLVAYSDSAIIRRPPQPEFPNVRKADSVPDRIDEIIQGHGDKSLWDLFKGPLTLSDKARKDVVKFLLKAHEPLKRVNPDAQNDLQQTTKGSPHLNYTQDFQCKNCKSKNLRVVYGKFGYYFKCDNCPENTPIKQICSKCNRKMKIRKSKNQFFAECNQCGISNLIYKNPG